MKKKKISKKFIIAAAAIIAIIAVSIIVYWLSIPPWANLKEEPNIPCGFTNCHGFDVSCGVPAECELVYQYGDNCRRFAHCAVVNGTCQTSIEPRFSQCIACVSACAAMLETDYLKGMECEYTCTL